MQCQGTFVVVVWILTLVEADRPRVEYTKSWRLYTVVFRMLISIPLLSFRLVYI